MLFLEYSTSNQRTFQRPDGSHRTIKIVSPENKLDLKLQARLQNILQNHKEFSNLDDSIWYDSSRLNALSTAISAELERTDDDMIVDLIFAIDQINETFSDLETIFKVLQVMSTDPKYSSDTEYNFLTLLRLGNQYLGADPVCYLKSVAGQLLKAS